MLLIDRGEISSAFGPRMALPSNLIYDNENLDMAANRVLDELTGLKNIYSRANPEVIFCGETKILPGMPAPDHETIEVVFRRRILVQALKNPDFFIKRLNPFNLSKKKKRNKKEMYETHEPTFIPMLTTSLELRARESKINH